MYIRNLRKASPVKNVSKFASAKMNNTIMCESPLEYDACFHHEYNEDVISFASQPEGFYYQFEGKSLPYTPDALIHYKDGTSQYLEYKPKSKTLNSDFKARFSARREAAKKLGIELVLVTETQIRVAPYLDNLHLLHRYTGIQLQTALQKSIISSLCTAQKKSLNHIAEQHKLMLGEARANVFSLLARGELKADLEKEDLMANPLIWSAVS